MNIGITSLSSRGQVVIPDGIRKELKLNSGSKFMVVSDGNNLLLKPIKLDKLDSFYSLIRHSRKFAIANKITKSSVSKLISKVRNENCS